MLRTESCSISVRGLAAVRRLILPLLVLASTASPAAISFVQQNYATPQSPQSSVSVTYPSAQVAGDTNIVAVGWTDTTSTATVADTNGNVYTLAVGPTRGGVQSQAVYVAKNVAAAAAGANTVTVTFSAAAPWPDVRILSYRGLDPTSPVEGGVGTTGNGTTSNSGPLATANANDLLFAAAYVSSLTKAAGTGFTSRVITSPDGDIAEDQVVAATGTYSGTATMSSGNWVMQLVALKAVGSLAAAATPTFSPAPGTYSSAQSVHLLDATTGATIYYTTNGNQPTTSSTVYNDASPIQVTGNTTIMAMAAASGFANSAVATGAYVIQQGTTATPTFNPSPGIYGTAQSVHLSDATSGATIYYTTNGNTPTTSSTVYNDASPIQVNATTTIKAMAAASGNANSAVATGTFSIGSSVPIAFVQMNYSVPSSQPSTVTTSYNNPQAAGDTNVVAIGWSNSTSTVTSVTDTKGNTYSAAVGPTVQSGVQSQVIYVANNIAAAAAGANTVTVKFSAAVPWPDVRILEYAGLDPVSPVERAVGTTGNGTTSNSGPLVTANGNDLLFAAAYVSSLTKAAGTGFTSRVITSPNGDIAEDQVVASPGTYSGTAAMSSGNWVMQLVALKAVGSLAAAATPTFSPAPGTYTSAQSVHLLDATTGATIYYTTNGNQPTTSSTVYNDASPIQVTGNTTIMAMAAASGFANSAVATGAYVIQQGTTATPTFNPSPGIYGTAQSVHLSDATSGATIYYTTNGNTPTTSSTVYNDASPIQVNATTTIKAMAAASGNANSAVATGTFSIGSSVPIAFVQMNYSVPSSQPSTVTTSYNNPQAAGDTNVVAIGWSNSTSTVTSVTDTKGNTYSAAVGPTVQSGVQSQVIYVANNIAAAAAGANTVTVKFSAAVPWPDVRILEYAGLDPVSPVDVVAGATGTAATSSSGPVTTTSPYDLIFSANYVTTSTTAAGNGFLTRVITNPDGDIAEDQTVTATGTYTGTATLSHAGSWIMQTVALRATGTAPPPPDPSVVGQWGPVTSWPVLPIHAVLMPTGKVLAWGHDSTVNTTLATVWNPSTNSFQNTTYSGADLFCAGHGLLPDGRVFIAGGHNMADYHGITNATIFDPTTLTWSAGAAMSFARWYPTVTSLPDGRMLVSSGAINCEGCNATVPEIYNPKTNSWTQLTSASLNIPIYPHMFVLGDGRVLNTGSYELPVPTRALDINAQSWTTVNSTVVDADSAVMYLPGKILKSGTSANSDSPYKTAAATAYVMDTTQSSPSWRAVSPMAFARSYHNLTVLPDGNVLVTGGEGTTNPFDQSTAVYAAEMWSPTAETFTTLSSMQVARVYHSTAVLLPDGRVLSGGSGEYGSGSIDQLNAEIYSPPYLFKGPRPTLTSAPSSLTYGAQFAVQTPDAANIASVSLIRLSSVTHAFNENQRFIPLSFTPSVGSLNVQAPANANLAPPGYYMLFLVNNAGVPSVGVFVQFPAP